MKKRKEGPLPKIWQNLQVLGPGKKFGDGDGGAPQLHSVYVAYRVAQLCQKHALVDQLTDLAVRDLSKEALV